MSKFNFLVSLNTYSDSNSSNSPSLNNFKWVRALNGVPASNPHSETHTLAPGEGKTLFSGVRTLSQDISTQYELVKKPLSSNTYIISHTAGAAPNFRAPRDLQIDNTTLVDIVLNGPLAILNFAGGAFNLADVEVGDYIRLDIVFNVSNRGVFKVLAKTASTITFENVNAVAESNVALDGDFANEIQVYSAAGVQAGDTLLINDGFSAVTQGSYKITAVYANSLEFYSTAVLPEEINITVQITVYSSAKQLIYIEANKKLAITVNGNLVSTIEPFIINDSVSPGVFLLKSTVYSLSIENQSTDTTTMFHASIE